MSETLSRGVYRVAGRLAELFAASFRDAEGPLAQGRDFLRSVGAQAAEAPITPDLDDRLHRLTAALSLSTLETNLLLLAGMPEEHEGFAAILRALHPRGESRPTAGLAAQLFSPARLDLRAVLETGKLAATGVIELEADVPFFDRTLRLGEGVWSALHGLETWPASMLPSIGPFPTYGLDEWLSGPEVARVLRAIRAGDPCAVLVSADSDELAFQRALAMVTAAGRDPVGFRLPAAPEARIVRLIQAHVLMRGSVPVLSLPRPEGPQLPEAPALPHYPETLVMSGRSGGVTLRTNRSLLAVSAEPISPRARRQMWCAAVPELNGTIASRAVRYSVEPSIAAEVAHDLRAKGRLDGRLPSADDLADSLRARATVSLASGIKLVRPTAHWDDLVLSRERLRLLHSAIDRLDLQATVLDEWGFLKGRQGARGVRMLFSGPPGTGKTFSAEVMARALGVDLMVVDISRVVSKWIGETEKNLAAVFDAAESAQAVLFFDEADALFGRRTEVSDAHDRYANLETAYLLTRLERFEGLAILATNLRQNIDTAFLRRLEFVIDFDEPDREERFQIWNRHIPRPDLLDEMVNLYEFAAHYAVVGGFIRNAAVSAAFLAAADGGRITRAHLVRSIRQEYDKAGRAFPGVPVGLQGVTN